MTIAEVATDKVRVALDRYGCGDMALKAHSDGTIIVRVNYSGNSERDALQLRAAHRALKAQGCAVSRIARRHFAAIMD